MHGHCAKLPSCLGLGEGCWLHKIRFDQVSAGVGAGEEVGAAVGPSAKLKTAFSKRFRPSKSEDWLHRGAGLEAWCTA